MNNSSNAVTGTVPLIPLLTVAFVVLKLTEVIAWSWLWVLSPLWIPFVLFIALALIVLVVAVIVAIVRKPRDRRDVKAAQARLRADRAFPKAR